MEWLVSPDITEEPCVPRDSECCSHPEGRALSLAGTLADHATSA